LDHDRLKPCFTKEGFGLRSRNYLEQQVARYQRHDLQVARNQRDQVKEAEPARDQVNKAEPARDQVNKAEPARDQVNKAEPARDQVYVAEYQRVLALEEWHATGLDRHRIPGNRLLGIRSRGRHPNQMNGSSGSCNAAKF
jgi:hypothetical protein